MWRSGDIRPPAAYDLRLQMIAAMRQLIVRCPRAADECLRLNVVRRLLERLRTAPRAAARGDCDLPRRVVGIPRIASQLTEQDGVRALRALLEIEPTGGTPLSTTRLSQVGQLAVGRRGRRAARMHLAGSYAGWSRQPNARAASRGDVTIPGVRGSRR